MKAVLDNFRNSTKEELDNMTDSEIHSLNILELIERFVIINGYTDHANCRNIEINDFRSVGADTVEFTVVSTKKRCRKPSFYHCFVLDEIHRNCKLVGFGNC